MVSNATNPLFSPMTMQNNEEKLIEIFIACDDFDKNLQSWLPAHSIGELKRPTRTPNLCDSELMTLLIFYQWSGYKNFQYYYQQHALVVLKTHFPKMPTYHRFLELMPRVAHKMCWFLQLNCLSAAQTGTYFIDSKALPVCHNKRIHQHKVFEGIAARGKTSMGWFFGVKIHFIINELGEIVNFQFTAGNVADNNHELLKRMLCELQGTCYGDKGYITKLFPSFYEQGLKIVTKLKSNMKNKLMDIKEKLNLKKRGVIESVNDILMTVFDIEHTRHRSPINAFTHMLAALVAYSFYDKKPSVFIHR